MSSILLKTAAAVVATYVGFSYTQAQTIEGSWNGKLDAGIAELSIVFNFSKGNDGKTQCTIPSREQRAFRSTLNTFRRIHWQWRSLPSWPDTAAASPTAELTVRSHSRA